MADEKRRYIAYLLRLWQENHTGVSIWRASLEDPHTGQRQGFADLERLFSFLRVQTAHDDRHEGSTTDSPS